MSEYDEQAEKFLKDTDTTFKAEFWKNGRHFPDDEKPRDIYKITLKKGERVYIFNFGQSIAKSDGKTKPTAYDVLASLTDYDPDTFGEFCSSHGYDNDSRKAERTYKAVVEEWKQVKILWSDEEIKQLQEIHFLDTFR